MCLHVHYMFNYVDKNAFCKILKLQVFSSISKFLRLFFSMYIFVPFHFIHPPPFAHCLLSHQINREMSRASPHGASSKQKYGALVNTIPLNLVRQTLQFPLQNQSGQVEIDRLAHQLRADTYFSAPTPRRTVRSSVKWALPQYTMHSQNTNTTTKFEPFFSFSSANAKNYVINTTRFERKTVLWPVRGKFKHCHLHDQLVEPSPQLSEKPPFAARGFVQTKIRPPSKHCSLESGAPNSAVPLAK